MKRSVVIIGAAVVLASTSAYADYVSAVLADGPEAYYRFEESTGAMSIADSSGNGHDSKTVSNVLLGQPGAMGNGGMFSNAYVQLNLQLSPDAGSFTIEALSCFDTTDINRHIASQQDGAGQGRALLYRGGSSKLTSYLGGEASTSTVTFSRELWHHVVMTVEDGGTNDTVRFYIDGGFVGENVVTSEATDGDWILGAAKDYTAGLIGLLDEVAIYTHQLSGARIAAHYNALISAPSVQTSSDPAEGGSSHNNMQPWQAINYLVALKGELPGAANCSNTMMSEIAMFAGNFAPAGWALADGQLLNIVENAYLFSIIGTTYGGDGTTTFALPDLRGRAAIHTGSGLGLSSRMIGQKTGQENVTLTEAQLPSHLHTLPPSADNTDLTGDGQPHNNMQPVLVTTYTIAIDSDTFASPFEISGNGPTFLGEIRCFAGVVAPSGTAKLDGQLLPTLLNADLFSILGTTYGGDGQTTFALPDLRGRMPVGCGQGSGLSNVIRGDMFGAETIALSAAQMPAHSHTWTDSSGLQTSGVSGNNEPHSNMQPSTGLNYIIALTGTVPSSHGTDLDEHFMGEVVLFAGDFSPEGWAFADGRLLAISSYPALYSLLGTTYGGDNRTTFALPDLRSRTAIQAGQGSELSNRGLGARSGAESATLTMNDIPAHIHTHSDPFTPVHYVSPNGEGHFPYTTWFSAAHTIQDAVDAAFWEDTVLVDSGTYNFGGTDDSRVAVPPGLTVRSIHGPEHTVINGKSTVRCVELGTNTTLSGFTLTKGFTPSSGGGFYCTSRSWYGIPLVSNCVITGNSAGYNGGGSYGGTLTHCTLTDNLADYEGGGSYRGTLTRCTLRGNVAKQGGGSSYGTLTHCTLTDNLAELGGGSSGGTLIHCTLSENEAAILSSSYNASGCGGGSADYTLKNCIVWGNTAEVSGDNWDSRSPDISRSCTMPDPGGTGNITNAPMFVSGNDFHLQAESPCIDAGTSLADIVDDLDGTPRPLDGDKNGSAIPDMGAYEYLNAAADSDGDSFTDGDEQIAVTGITDSNDWFHVSAFTSNCIVSFDSSEERQYTLQSCTNLIDGVWSNVAGQVDAMGNGGELTLIDPVATNSPCFYRVLVEIP
ncbi:MAG: tail fiber protein [Kiritimatiellales bacterium]|nr:tail fiber protein [Kiritimatiellales bacterium]